MSSLDETTTTCIRGHIRSPENTRLVSTGDKVCIPCMNMADKRWREKNSETYHKTHARNVAKYIKQRAEVERLRDKLREVLK